MYITYEKTMDISNEGLIGAVCGWSSEAHIIIMVFINILI
jgi:hypothetical protein